MIARLAYHDSTVRVCRTHYDRPLRGVPPLGPVEDARHGQGCAQCDVISAGHACVVRLSQETERTREPDLRRILTDARQALQAALTQRDGLRADVERVAHLTREGWAHLRAWDLIEEEVD